MARKVFISFLGGSNYGECSYVKNDFKSSPVSYIQEAMLDMYGKSGNWTENDIAYILLTKGAESANWNDDGHIDRNTNEPIKRNGLHSQLKLMDLKMQVAPVKKLPDGNNESEILEIFQTVYDLLQNEDELYFDVTHGFRYLPMLSIVLGNYAKSLKKTKVISITYGNYEARDKENNIAQIVDLMTLSALQDWSSASEAFIKNGEVNELVGLCNQSLSPILKAAAGQNEEATRLRKIIKNLSGIVNDFRTCRGINIIEAKTIKNLQKELEDIQQVVVPTMQPVLNNIKERFKDYESETSEKKGFIAAEWCLEHGLAQQAITIYFENIVTFFCFIFNLDWRTERERDLVNKALNFSLDNTPEDKWSFKEGQDTPENRDMIKRIMTSDSLKECLIPFGLLRDLRNDFNHSGMRNNPMSADRLVSKLKLTVEKINNVLGDFPKSETD